MRRRYVLKNKRRFLIIVMVTISVVFSSLILITKAPKSKTIEEYDEIVVVLGDTLWDIADDIDLNEDIRKTVYRIKKINNLDNAKIKAGQVLLIPKY